MSELRGDSNFCGSLAYRILEYDTALDSEVPFMHFDEVTKEFWMDLTTEYEKKYYANANFELVLEVSLNDWPDVTPVFQIIDITVLCPTQHSSIQILGTPKPTLIEYDVTEAAL